MGPSVHRAAFKFGWQALLLVLFFAAVLTGCSGSSSAPVSQPVAPSTYSVSYSANGATSGSVPVDGNKYSSGATVTVLGNTGSLAQAGDSFAGWNTAANGSGTSYAPGATFTMANANVTLYAQWTPLPTYSVTYSANGATSGSVPVDGNKYSSGATVTVLGNTGNLAQAGYSFAGWNTAANGSGTSYAPGATFTIASSNVTLYAQWSPTGSTFTVTYLGNGSTSGFGVPDPNQYKLGYTVTVLGNLGFFFKPDYVLTGWNTAADGSGTTYTVGSTFAMGPANVTLYAQWQAANWPPVSIWGGAREAVALKADGTVWTWGINSSGELGNGLPGDSAIPVQVVGPGGSGHLTNVVAIMGGELHNVALQSDGTVWAWGSNLTNQLGDGMSAGAVNNTNSPVQVSNLSSIVKLGSRDYFTIAVKSDGTVWAWGYDEYGALGIGVADRNYDYPVPVQVQGVTNPIMVTTGYVFGIALLQDHTLVAWGNNVDGEMGNGTTSSTGQLNAAPIPGLDHVIWVSAGWTHSVAIRSDGTVWTWGANSWTGAFDTCNGVFCGYGKLGDGTTNDHYTPEQVPGLSGAVMAVAGDASTSVLLRDGTVWTFGSNGTGQLGVPGIAQSLVPVQVQGLCHAVYIMTRDFHNEALCSDGTLWSWGSGENGELGNGTWANSAVPVQVMQF